MTPEEIFKKRWGYDAFKPLQREAIEAAPEEEEKGGGELPITALMLPTG